MSLLRAAFRAYPGSIETDDGIVHAVCLSCGGVADLLPNDRIECVAECSHEEAEAVWLDWYEDFLGSRGDSEVDHVSSGGTPRFTPNGDTPHDRAATAQQSRAAAWDRCRELASEERILDCLGRDLRRVGLVGEVRTAKLVYLAVTSRLLDKPVSVVVKGPSAGGKSYMVESVLSFFPDEAYYAMTGMSERALAYSQEPLEHRMLVIYEAVGMASDWASYLVRSLLSEGEVRYETVEKTKDGMRSRLITRAGPTGLIVTTTQVKLHPENETRLLSLPVTDTPEQTQAVMLAVADDEQSPPDLLPWISLQGWVATGDHEVSIPFAKQLAGLVPPVAVRLRRDFPTVLGLVKAHALLHQATRARDTDGRIVATLEDYDTVRELVHDLVADGIDATVPQTTRDTVRAVERLAHRHEGGVPQGALVRELDSDRSTVSRRVKVAIAGGYLRNLEDRKGRPAKLVIGDPLPDDVEILPTRTTLEANCCGVAHKTGVIEAPPQAGRPTAAEAPQGTEPAGSAEEQPDSVGDLPLGTPEDEAEAERVHRKWRKP